jgi:hypothetical protein
MKTTIIGAAVFILFIARCGDKPQERTPAEGVPVITVSSIEETVQDTSFLRLTDIVYLETTDSSLIADIKKIAADDDYLFVFDRKQRKVFIFDENGKFINQISRIGQGPNEYASLWDISVDPFNKNLMLWCDRPYKIMYFTYMGDFIREENSKSYSGIVRDSNFLYLDQWSDINMQKSSFQVDIRNISDNSVKSELPHVENIKNWEYNNGLALTKGKSAIYYVRRYDFNIYQFIDGHVVNKYFVDFRRYAVPDDLKELEDGVLEYCNRNFRIFSMTNVVDNGNLMMFYTDRAIFFYDKKADLLTGYKKLIISNGKKIGLYGAYLPIANTDKIAYSTEAVEFIMFYKLPDGVTMPEGLNMDSNPVLLIYELK